MISKRILLVAVALVMTVPLFLSCGKSNQDSTNGDGTDKVYTYSFNMYVQDDNEYPTGVSYFDEMVLEKFGIKFEYDRIPRSNWEQKTNILFASNNPPDLTTGGKENNYKTWASKGFLEPVDVNKMPDFKKLWSEEEFEKVIELASSADGNLYYIPYVRAEKVQMCWLYRKDVFDKLGLEFPKTIDEFYTVLTKLKEAYPDNILWSANGGKTAALTSMMQSYWMPELVLQQNSYKDPITGEFVPYALTGDNAREMYKFYNKVYKEGLIDREIMSIEKEQFYNRLSTGNVFMAYNYVYNIELLNEKSKRADENAEWTWSPHMITAYPEKGTIYKRDPYYSNWGPAFSTNINSEPGKFDAILDLFNWFATEEGMRFNTFGIEGESYDMVNNVPVMKEGWYHETKNPTGTRLSSAFGSIGNVYQRHPQMFKEARGYMIEPLYEAFTTNPNYYYFEQLPMQYTDEEEPSRVDLETSLGKKRDEYMAKFLMNEADPNNDADWETYISDMNKVGLKTYSDLQTKVFSRIK